MNTIYCSSVGYKIGGRFIFNNVDFSFDSYKITAITGVSGSGKSSLINILGLITNPTVGELYINQDCTNNWNENKRSNFWKTRASFIFQDYGVIEDESVEYNIALQYNVSKKEKEEINKILNHVGLANRSKDLASVLSGGEKQRLGIARAIYKKSDIIFADEPTASLDVCNRNKVINLLKERADQGGTIVVATHDDNLLEYCDEIHTL